MLWPESTTDQNNQCASSLIIKKFKKVIVIAMFLFPLSSYANHECTGEVLDVHLNTEGQLSATISGIATNSYLCELSSDYCRALYSGLLISLTSSKSVTLWFNNDDINNKKCFKGNWVNLYKDYGFYHFRLKR